MTVTEAEKKQIQQKGYAVIGVDTRKTYWTPDGREVRSQPNIVGFRKDGAEGTRDANLDKGWLLAPPGEDELKLRCPHCDKWHDDQRQIAICGKKWRAFYAKKSSDIPKDKDKEIDELKAELAEIKQLVRQLAKGDKHEIL